MMISPRRRARNEDPPSSGSVPIRDGRQRAWSLRRSAARVRAVARADGHRPAAPAIEPVDTPPPHPGGRLPAGLRLPPGPDVRVGKQAGEPAPAASLHLGPNPPPPPPPHGAQNNPRSAE